MGKNFFDETSGRWIKILKALAIASFFGFILAGLIVGIVQADYDGFGAFLLYFAGGAVLAFVQLVGSMLLINFLNNVQMIREKLGCEQGGERLTPPQEEKDDSLEQLLAQGLITKDVYDELKRKQD